MGGADLLAQARGGQVAWLLLLRGTRYSIQHIAQLLPPQKFNKRQLFQQENKNIPISLQETSILEEITVSCVAVVGYGRHALDCGDQKQGWRRPSRSKCGRFGYWLVVQ